MPAALERQFSGGLICHARAALPIILTPELLSVSRCCVRAGFPNRLPSLSNTLTSLEGRMVWPSSVSKACAAEVLNSSSVRCSGTTTRHGFRLLRLLDKALGCDDIAKRLAWLQVFPKLWLTG